MKLQAVTICINYADFLECAARNRGHFDKWVVVTCAHDWRTRKLCSQHQIDCIVSTLLQPDGTGFHAAEAKWHVLNEGLEVLEQEGWAVALDTDVLLPRHFRERVDSMPLELGCLYGVEGRKVIKDRQAFEQARECEPWNTFVGRNSLVIGYFNLFSLETTPNRYVRRQPDDHGGSHDDWRFTTSFAKGKHRLLPMTVIHTGSPGANWVRRKAPDYGLTERGSLPEDAVDRMFRCVRWGEESCSRSAAMIGYFPGGRWRCIAARCSQVWMFDHFRVQTPSANSLWEADRATLRRLLTEEINTGFEVENLPSGQLKSSSGRGNSKVALRMLGPHSDRTLADIPDGSLNLLYLPGETGPDWLTVGFPHWFSKLHHKAVVCGDLFGLPHWPEVTFVVSLLMGLPDHVAADGFWWKTMHSGDWRFDVSRKWQTGFRTENGVLLVNQEDSTVEKLLLSLHTVCHHWAGPIAVYHSGAEYVSLGIVCERLGVKLLHLDVMPEQEQSDGWIKYLASVQPFRRALVFEPGMLAVKPLAAVFDEPTRADDAASAVMFHSQPGEVAGGEASLMRALAVKADVFTGSADEPAILTFSGEPDCWTDASWEVWSLTEAEMAQKIALEVRVPTNSSIVAIVDAELAGDFQRNWLTWRFRPAMPILLILVGIADENLWLADTSNSTRIVSLSKEEADDLPSLLRWIAEQCTESRVVFLPGNVAAFPGAELWCGKEREETLTALHWSEDAQSTLAATGNLFLPQPFFGSVDRDRLASVAETNLAAQSTLRELPYVFYQAIRAASADLVWMDMTSKGWQRTPTHLCVRVNWKPRRTYGDDVVIRTKAGGQHDLADDVVVINLPERTDRHQRIKAALERERVRFRFVDGVRVVDADIQPEEIADVGWAAFKTKAGYEKYLRGIVGCRRAHLRCLQEAFDNGKRSLLVLEDDMVFEHGWQPRLSAALAELPSDSLQLYFSAAKNSPIEPVSTQLHRLKGALGTTAILYSKAGIEASLACLQRSRM